MPVQLLMATTWACVGRGDSSVRYAWLTFYLLMAVAAVYFFTYPPAKLVDDYLLFYAALVVTVCAGFYITKKIGWVANIGLLKTREFQVSVMEMIAWMTGVSIAAACSRIEIDARELQLPEWRTFVATLAALPVLTIALLQAKINANFRHMLLPTIPLLLGIVTVAMNEELNSDNYAYLAGAYFVMQAYLVLGYTVQRLNSLSIC
ncbi:hypothetical protein [Adhaeretor mobilis]|uniref:hypothetical protein n=1 Tax=Adhaeretor mobilis TaxID=1930276 RepID=UPI0011A54C16|nr:hypothetical protein [Adhaeretor mobilis]